MSRRMTRVAWLLWGLLPAVAGAAVPAPPPSLSPAAAKPVLLATHELCPYGCTGPDGRFDGIAVRVVHCALDRLALPHEVLVYPWARAQQEVRNGELDGFFGASRNADRDTWAELSATIAPQQWRWYLPAKSPLDPAQADFRTRANVASYIGANMLDWLDQNGYRVSSRPPDTPALLDNLLAGRIDAALASHLVMDRLLAERGLTTQVKSYLAQDKPLGVYFSKRFLAGHPGFMAQFNDAVAVCTARQRRTDWQETR